VDDNPFGLMLAMFCNRARVPDEDNDKQRLIGRNKIMQAFSTISDQVR
jgi:hypothetical protein